jgi:hypothetical protein
MTFPFHYIGFTALLIPIRLYGKYLRTLLNQVRRRYSSLIKLELVLKKSRPSYRWKTIKFGLLHRNTIIWLNILAKQVCLLGAMLTKVWIVYTVFLVGLWKRLKITEKKNEFFFLFINTSSHMVWGENTRHEMIQFHRAVCSKTLWCLRESQIKID